MFSGMHLHIVIYYLVNSFSWTTVRWDPYISFWYSPRKRAV